MLEKRRDSRGRILRDNEYQRPDGKYEYRYKDTAGVRRSVYSWRLVGTDKTPNGKRPCIPLREIERSLAADNLDGVDTHSARAVTLNDCVESYLDSKRGLKDRTKFRYISIFNCHIKNDIGKRKIAEITYSDIKRFYISLIENAGLKVSSLHNVHVLLNSVLSVAVRDRIIRANPASGVYAETKKSFPQSGQKRRALTAPQQDRFVNFLSKSRKYAAWKPLFTVLLGTGGRIGEILGLRWEDCDFDARTISINHSISYGTFGKEHCSFRVSSTKTKAGERIIPMFTAVREALLTEYEKCNKVGRCTYQTGDYTDFVFYTGKMLPLVPSTVGNVLNHIIRDANSEETEAASKEGRKPILLPHFSCHSLRHTFCTRLCEQGVNIKVIQDVMGHKNITVTLNVYAEATREKKMESFAALDGAIKL